MVVLVFPGQGSQFEGMGKDLFEANQNARSMFREADEILGYSLSTVMFEGSNIELKKTNITQPAIFLHSIITLRCSPNVPEFGGVAGHSLGEFSALVANGCLGWQDALKLVQLRAIAMQKACEEEGGTMAAVIGLEDELVERICLETGELVVAANYNCPGQVVISGTLKGIEVASENLINAGARRVLPLAVGGAFHSKLMSSARKTLETAIQQCNFVNPTCPIYQNVNGLPSKEPDLIKQNLIDQLDSPVKWTQSMQCMIEDGADKVIEVGGSGKVLSGMFKRLDRNMATEILVV